MLQHQQVGLTPRKLRPAARRPATAAPAVPRSQAPPVVPAPQLTGRKARTAKRVVAVKEDASGSGAGSISLSPTSPTSSPMIVGGVG